MRLSRKLGTVKSIKLPSLYEFWSDATIVECHGAHSSALTRYEDVLVGNSSTPLWVFASKGNSFEVGKIKNGLFDKVLTFREAGGGILSLSTGITDTTISATKIFLDSRATDGIYGYVLASLRFPSFSEAIIDKMFSKMYIDFDSDGTGYRYNSGTGSVYIADDSLSSDQNVVYLQAGAAASTGYFSITRGGTPGTAIKTSGSIPFWRHYNSRYYLSSNGTGNLSTRVGVIHKIHLSQW